MKMIRQERSLKYHRVSVLKCLCVTYYVGSIDQLPEFKIREKEWKNNDDGEPKTTITKYTTLGDTKEAIIPRIEFEIFAEVRDSRNLTFTT